MLKAEQIPDEVVEATAWAMCDDINGEGAWDETPFRHRPMWRSAARASIAAAINAWPGMWHIKPIDFEGKIILPLRQETRDELEPSQRTYSKYEAAERIWRLEKVIVRQDKEIRRLQSLLERAVSRGCNHCIEVIGPIRKDLETDLD